ncbi:unnamed protein product [Adineta steineri]|uniref:Ganglioside GM2 activator n=1 Tax=Adineta steineri TaxID=433720 RepID=A0A819E8L4_9BILA|nr:unnamed protein product [Adineta steineri]
MRFLMVPLALIAVVLIFKVHGQDFTKLQFQDCGSKHITIEEVDVKPMPIINPGPASMTFVAQLKKPVTILYIDLNIIRTVSGIALPVRCYIVNGQNVGSCTYPDICAFIKDLVTDFHPDTCHPTLIQHGINCVCPFNIPIQRLLFRDHPLDLPDASQSAATFMASGNFDITVKATESAAANAELYGCGRIHFTVKQQKA